MDTDLNDIEKIQVVLASSSRQPAHDETANAEFPQRCNYYFYIQIVLFVLLLNIDH
jgi:hypothetical protein